MDRKTLLVIILILLLVAGGYYFYQQSQSEPTTPANENQEDNSQQIVGNDQDAHGCIGSAGYSWCEPKNKCLRIWEESCYSSPEQEIQYALASKYGKSISEVTVRATKKTADYMVGSVNFAAKGLPSPGEGGLFMAAKEGNIWTLVFDGNGSINCQEIKQKYNFPQDMLQGICD